MFGIFDCCRNEIKVKKQATKGAAKSDSDDSEDSADDSPMRTTNCVFLYRCRPSDTASATSAMSSALCQQLNKLRDPATGNVVGVAAKLTYWAGPEGTANLVNYARSDFELPLDGILTEAEFDSLFSQETRDKIKAIQARFLFKGVPFQFKPFPFPKPTEEEMRTHTWK